MTSLPILGSCLFDGMTHSVKSDEIGFRDVSCVELNLKRSRKEQEEHGDHSVGHARIHSLGKAVCRHLSCVGPVPQCAPYIQEQSSLQALSRFLDGAA